MTTTPRHDARTADLGRVRRDDLERALRHHRRAIEALASTSFEELPRQTALALRQRLQLELEALDAELRRRTAPARGPAEASAGASLGAPLEMPLTN